MGIGRAIARGIAREQRRQVSGQHQTWPEQWKRARASARIVCQQNPRFDFSATAEMHFRRYVAEASGRPAEREPMSWWPGWLGK